MVAEILPKIDNLFDFLSTHHEMLSDSIRVDAYEQAITNVVQPGSVIADVGTGTGVLALLCARAGAKRIYAIECRPIIDLAKKIAKDNGLEDKIVFLKGDSRRVTLPEKVDVIVSEILGHAVLEENMLDTIIDAKTRFLKKHGTMIPESANLMFAPTSNRTTLKEISFWRRPLSGLNFRPAWNKAVNTVYDSRIKPQSLLAESQVLRFIDFKENKHTQLKGVMKFSVTKKGPFHGFAAWFEALLTKKGNVCVRTSPFDPPTHWKCAFFPVANPVNVSPGDTVLLNLSCYSTGNSTVWEWRGTVTSVNSEKSRFSQSTELY